ncbi:MAG TPA: hypothetical protein VMH20_10450 [Verrucomicrobiae bacterium]|nr:hypothetical protein [Verrucomicrobiae bacterium]
MQCKELEAVLASEGLSPLPPDAREHLSGCANCQDLLADLSAIAVAAKRIPAEVTPPDRVWNSIRAQLEAEGIIRDVRPAVVAPSTPWWDGIAQFFRPRALATAAAALFVVAGAAYVVEHHNTSTPSHVAEVPPSAKTRSNLTGSAVPPAEVSQTVSVSNAPSGKPVKPRKIVAARPNAPAPADLKPSPSENAYLGDSRAVLADVQDSLPRSGVTNNPAVDASLRQNLRTINDFIAECEARLKQNPRDQLTREYLNMAYQQKAELLNAMMDTGRSEH